MREGTGEGDWVKYKCNKCGGNILPTEDDDEHKEYGFWGCNKCGKLFDSELISGKPIIPEDKALVRAIG